MPQMGPLSWVLVMIMVLSLVIVYLVLLYFLPKDQFTNKRNKFSKISYKWVW